MSNVKIRIRQGLARCLEANVGKVGEFAKSNGSWMCKDFNSVSEEERYEIDKLILELLQGGCQHKLVKRYKDHPKFVRCLRCSRVEER